MLEQPSAHFAIFDLDNVSQDLSTTAKNICNTMHQLIENPDPDFEFAQKGGVVDSLR